MVIRDITLCVCCFLLLMGALFFSSQGYRDVLHSEFSTIVKKEKASSVFEDVLRDVTVETLNQEVPITRFKAVQKRNPFDKVKPKPKPKIEKVNEHVVLSLPEPEPVELEIPKVEELYIYRGIVVLGGTVSYVVERDRDKKTFFVNKGDKTKDFIVLETNEKQVVITDYDENIKVLKVLK
ncbi:MAG: hypothetical protein KKH94_06440 [Candidatus Omnitrophica bacterium]|nr:hypothetical protein [Candidatus Omnitrophota bacterium]